MKKFLFILCGIGFLTFAFNSAPQKFDPVEELKSELHDHRARETTSSNLEDKTVLLYFSAKWCPPCQQFTPKLVDFQKQHSQQVDVVLVSWDRSVDAMKAYINEKKMGDFYSIPPGSQLNRVLSDKFDIKGIPSVVVVNPSGSVVTEDGRRHITFNEELPAEWTQ